MGLRIHSNYIFRRAAAFLTDREYLLKVDVSNISYSDTEGKSGKETLEKKWDLLCAECSRAITSDSERIEVNGAHEHTFVNPNGVIFQIGCFDRVSGIDISGQATEQWSWFNGYSWRIVCCDRCGIHLGWVYLTGREVSFYGLILSRLLMLN